MRRLIAIALFLTIIAPVALWAMSPLYAPWLANRLLAGSDLHVQELKIRLPHWRQVTITSLVLASKDTGTITAENTVIQRLKGFSKFDVDVQNAEVVLYGEKENIVRETSEPTLLSELLPETLLTSLPEIFLTVANLQFKNENDISAFAVNKNLRIKAGREDIHLQSQLLIEQNNIEQSFDIELNINASNSATLKLSKADNPRPILNASVSVKHQENTFDINLDLLLEDDTPSYIYSSITKEYDYSAHINTHFNFSMLDQPLNDLLNAPQLTLQGQILAETKAADEQFSARLATNIELLLQANLWQLNLDMTDKDHPYWLEVQKIEQGKPHLLHLSYGDRFTLNGDPSEFFSDILANSATKTSVKIHEDNSIDLHYSVNNALVAKSSFKQFQWNGFLPTQDQFQITFNTLIDADLSKLLDMFLSELKPDLQVKAATLHLPATINIDVSHLSIHLQENAEIAAKEAVISIGTFSNPKVSVPPQTIKLDFSTALPDRIQFNFVSQALATETHTLTPMHIAANASIEAQAVQWKLSNEGFTLQKGKKGEKFFIPPYYLQGETQLQNTLADAKTFLATSFSLSNQCEESIMTGKLQEARYLSLQTEKRFSTSSSFNSWVNQPLLNSDIVAGELTASLQWDLNSTLLPLVQVNLNNGQALGTLGNFNDIQLSLSSRKVKSSHDYSLKAAVGSMNIGAQVSNLAITAVLNQVKDRMTINLHEINANMFGGRIWVENTEWTLGQSALISLHMDQLDLAEVVLTQNIQGLLTSGKLGGIIPLTISADGDLAIAKGTLVSTETGAIRYHSELSNSADLNDQLKLTMNVLENFQYQKLETQTEFHDGVLILHSKISGSNPDVAGGQKVDLNLNTEVALNSAFQAMRLQAGLEAKVEKLFSPHSSAASSTLCKKPH